MKRIYALIAVAFLAACASQPASVTTPAAAAATTVVSSGDMGALLNAERSRAGLPALARSAKLAAAARGHAADLNRNGFLSHTGSNGSTPAQRVRAQGYGYCYVAENVAQGYPTAARTMQGWMGSAGHRRNNLSRKATQFGVAQAGDTWVLVFGRPGC